MQLRRVAALVMVLLTSVAATVAAPKPSIVTAKPFLSVSGLKPGTDFRLAVVMEVEKGYHIGAAVPTALYPAKLEFKAPAGVTIDKPVFPKETLKSFDFSDKKLPVYEGKFTVFATGHVAKNAAPGARTIEATFTYQSCSDTTCTMPDKVVASIPTKVVKPNEAVSPINKEIFNQVKPVGKSKSSSIEDIFARGGLFGFLAIFGMGILLCLTPCVYPMVPVTIGFFGMQTEKRTSRVAFLAGLYVLGIAVTYSILGFLAARTGAVFGSMLSSPYVPSAIAAVLVVLALSMFGMYELRPPSWLASKSHGQSGALGALMMGLLFGVVAAPCVGPVTVTLLLLVAKVGKPTFGLLSFFTLALGMGTPLFVLAMFSGAVHRIPQAGMWMVSVKKVFGMLLIGAAIYYVTPVAVTHVSARLGTAMLPIFIMLSGLYIGWLEKGFGKAPAFRNARKLVGVTVLAVGLMQMPSIATPKAEMAFQPYTDAAVDLAAREHKPVMIDFSAQWCAACRELGEKTFPAPQVQEEGSRFVRLQADMTDSDSEQSKALTTRYYIKGLPTVVFLDSNGQEVTDARVTGFLSPQEMLAKMKTIK